MFIGADKLTHTYMPGSPYAAQALKEVTFSLNKGDIALIIGPSGSGKSTLIQHLNGLLRPTSGQVFFKDKLISSDKNELFVLRRKIGLVFQMPEEQFFSETVFDEIAFAPRNLGLEDSKVKSRVRSALEKVGLPDEQILNRHPFQLSAGQKRLVAIAAVLALEPEVLILDEPTAGLDPRGRDKLFSLLEYLNRQQEMTIIVSTHYLDTITALANQVLVMEKGNLVLNGSVSEVFSQREKINELGLALPAVTEIMSGLAERGLPLRCDLFSLQEARLEINKLKEQRKQ